MLARFIVENFRSFKEEAIFSLLATKDDQHPGHVFEDIQGKNIRLLRGGALYGANASGKSNLIEAILFAQDLIIKGTRGDQSISIAPYKLSKEKLTEPSRFEFDIKYQKVLYNYGFKVDSTRIQEEWLFATVKKKETRYFERRTLADGTVHVEFGPSFTGKSSKDLQFLEFVAQGTRPNQLFLTEAVDRNIKLVKPIIDWFKDVLTIVPADSLYFALSVKLHTNRSFTQFLSKFLRTADTGIYNIVTEEEPPDFDKYFFDMPADQKGQILDAISRGSSVIVSNKGQHYEIFQIVWGNQKQPMRIALKTQHITENGEMINFDFAEESDGTQRLMHLIPILFGSRTSERVYFIDELDRRLHPLLSKMFLEAYLDCDPEQRGQLIFTTHDTNLLDLSLLRRDEIWFVEKNGQGASQIYSLAEFKIRPDLILPKGYLSGRFGAIPFIGDISKLELASSSQMQS